MLVMLYLGVIKNALTFLIINGYYYKSFLYL